MDKRTLLTSTIYSILQASSGLILHPYQTMQHLVEDRVFLWLTFLPIYLGILFYSTWWFSLQFLFRHLPYLGAWAFSLIWGSSFLLFWQILLLYLFLRFFLTLR